MSLDASMDFLFDDSAMGESFALFDNIFIEPAPASRSEALLSNGVAAAAANKKASQMIARKPSPTGSVDPDRNARMAKANRDRHKQYVNGLENSVAQLTKDNQTLTVQKTETDRKLEAALAEIAQLKAALAGQSCIAQAVTQLGFALNFTGNLDAAMKHGSDAPDDFVSKRSKQTVVLPFHVSIQLPM